MPTLVFDVYSTLIGTIFNEDPGNDKSETQLRF